MSFPLNCVQQVSAFSGLPQFQMQSFCLQNKQDMIESLRPEVLMTLVQTSQLQLAEVVQTLLLMCQV